MGRIAFHWLVAAGVGAALALALPPQKLVAATGGAESEQYAEAAAGPARELADSADLMLHYFQEDGADSGHVRILLVPETRALTQPEARTAAQHAFLQALKEPGLGDNLSRITVVVRLMPASLQPLGSAEQTVVFLHKGGRDWSVLAGE